MSIAPPKLPPNKDYTTLNIHRRKNAMSEYIAFSCHDHISHFTISLRMDMQTASFQKCHNQITHLMATEIGVTAIMPSRSIWNHADIGRASVTVHRIHQNDKKKKTTCP